MKVTATELKVNLGRLIDYVINSNEEIIVTKNGKSVVTLSKINEVDEWINELSGIAEDTGICDKTLKAERILDKYESLT